MSKFSEELENLTKKQRDIANAKKAKKEYPTGVTWSEKVGKGEASLKSKGKPTKSVWEAHLQQWGFDPKEFEVLNNTIQYRGWDTNMGNGQVERMHYYKADIVKK